MKKLIALFAVAALVLPLAIACNPEDKPAKEVVMQPGPTAESAMVVSFEASPEKPHFQRNGQNLELIGVEFTESGRALLVCQPLLAESVTKTGISGISMSVKRSIRSLKNSWRTTAVRFTVKRPVFSAMTRK